jgi:formate dehydrogenase beta subunit
VSCLGRCDSAPAVAVNDRPAPVSEVDALVDAAHEGGVGDAPAQLREEPWPNDPYPAGSGVAERYATLRALLAGDLDPDDLVAVVKESGLRGMGGAGFPTGQKWELVRGTQPGSVKYAICNADESEPGTFKDRQILATQPHLVLEGLLLGMAVVGAEQGWVFIRHEYGPEEHVLRTEIDALRAAGVVGADACGSGRRLDVDVFVSPGGYILGEETALLECMEGHRGEPRNKPPFPGNYGLHGRPTLINSVETFADVPVIVQRGAQWWHDQGVGESVGWKFFAVSGHVERPDVYCVPMGTTVGQLIDLAGGVSEGRQVGAVQPGGASSNFIGPDQLDMALDFGAAAQAGTMLGSGALVVLAAGTDLLAAATNVLRFFRDESCGKCVPCRVGSTKAHTILRDVVEAGAELGEDQRAHVLRLEEAMRKTSICGLGQVALGPVVSVLGLDKGGAAARDQPRPGGEEGQPDR